MGVRCETVNLSDAFKSTNTSRKVFTAVSVHRTQNQPSNVRLINPGVPHYNS